jgi:hypothetical protein
MKKLKILALLIGTFLLINSITGCGQPVNIQESPGSGVDEEVNENAAETEEEPEVSDDPPEEIELDDDFIDIGMGGPIDISIEELTEGLTENEYPDLIIEAVVLERMAILPGSTIRVSITITNQGEETVAFVVGSGSNEIPEALRMVSDELQPILSQDRLGFATMDFVVETLEPGDTINYSLYVKAIMPNENFNDYTFQLFAEDQSYIGEMDWQTVAGLFPDLLEVEPGTYSVSVYFIYSLVGAGGDGMFGEATGFNVATLEIVVD